MTWASATIYLGVGAACEAVFSAVEPPPPNDPRHYRRHYITWTVARVAAMALLGAAAVILSSRGAP